MEMITRAKTMLYILLVDHFLFISDYSVNKGYFQQAAEEGLVEIVKLNDEEVNEGNEGSDEDEEDEGNEGSDEVKEVEEVNKGDSCFPGCCSF